MSYGVLAGVAIGLFLLIYMFFKFNRFNDSEQGKNHFLLQLIILFFILVGFVLLGKATLDVSSNCQQEIVNSTLVGSTYTFNYDVVCNDSPYTTGSIFYKIVLWFVRIFSFYIFIYIAYEVLRFFGVIIPK